MNGGGGWGGYNIFWMISLKIKKLQGINFVTSLLAKKNWKTWRRNLKLLFIKCPLTLYLKLNEEVSVVFLSGKEFKSDNLFIFLC